MATAKKKTGKKKTGKRKSKGKGMVNYDAQMAKFAAAASAKEKESGGGGGFISLKGGEFTFKGDVLPGPLQVVILDTAFENAYYDAAWDDENPSPPACFAVSNEVTANDELEPHETSPDTQCSNCEECEMNEWGSADTGRGKACSNNRRLMVISADDLDDLEGAQPAMIRLSPTSIKHWSGYAKKITNVMKLPPFAVITELELSRVDGKTYYELKPSFVEAVNKKHIPELIELVDSIQEDLVQPYDVSSYGEEAPKKKSNRRKVKKKAVKKKAAKKKSKKRSRKF